MVHLTRYTILSYLKKYKVVFYIKHNIINYATKNSAKVANLRRACLVIVNQNSILETYPTNTNEGHINRQTFSIYHTYITNGMRVICVSKWWPFCKSNGGKLRHSFTLTTLQWQVHEVYVLQYLKLVWFNILHYFLFNELSCA